MSEFSDLNATCNAVVPRERERWEKGVDPFRIKFGPSGSLDGAAQQVLILSGELDLATAPQLAKALRLASGAVLIDCRSLSFMDVAGIEVLEEALEHVDSIRLVNVGPRVRRILTIVGLDEKFLTDVSKHTIQT